MALTTNERNILKKLWPQLDWPLELEREHDRRLAVLKAFGMGYALNNQQIFDLALTFLDEDGCPLRDVRRNEESDATFTAAEAREHFEEQVIKPKRRKPEPATTA